MVDVDWLTLAFGLGTALIAGGIAFGGARAGAAARDAANRRELDKLWEEVRELRRECHVCPGRHSSKNSRPSP